MKHFTSRTLGRALCAAVLGLAACQDGLFVDPAPASTRADVALSLALGGSMSSGGPRQAFDRVDGMHVRMLRSDSTVVLDTVVSIAPNASDVEMTLDVPITSPTETLTLTVELRDGGATLFTGASTVTVARGQTTAAEVAPEPVVAGVRGPALPTFTAVGDTMTLQGVTLFASGDTIGPAPMTWTSSNPQVIEIVGNRLFTRGQGQANIVATSGTFTATTVATVASTVGRITLTPSSLTLMPGTSATVTAATMDRNGNPVTGRPLEWTSTNPAVATVANGVVTGVTEGEATIRVTADSTTAFVDVVVAFEPVTRVVLAPDTATIFMHGTLQMAVQVFGASNTPMPKPVTWTSLDPLTATVSSTGLVTGVGQGIAEIVATSEGKADTARVNVLRNPIAQVRITPRTPSVAIGDSVPLTVELLDAQGRATTGGYATQITNLQVLQNATTRPPEFYVRGQTGGTAYFIVASNDGPRDSVLVTVTGTAPGNVFTDSARVTTSSAELFGHYDPNGNVVQHFFEYSTSANFSTIARTPTRTPPAATGVRTVQETIAGLAPNTLYYFRLVAMVGASRYVLNTRTLYTGIPAAPTGVVPERSLYLNSAYVGVGWNAPAGHTELQRSLDANNWQPWTTASYGGSGVFNTVDSTAYWFRIRHCNTIGCSAFSAAVRAPDLRVTAVQASGANSVNVFGHVSTFAEATTVVAEVSTDPNFINGVFTSPQFIVQAGQADSQVTLTVAGLTPGTQYYARLRARSPTSPTASTTAIAHSRPFLFQFTPPAPGRGARRQGGP